MRLSDLATAEQVLAEDLADPPFRTEWDKTAFARQVAIRLAGYRAEHGLTQTQLARKVGMTQSVIARLEHGEHPPSLATLAKLSAGLNIELNLTITPTAVALTA